MDNTIRTKVTEVRDPTCLLAGLLIGGLAGVGAMMLLAPQSGRKTRTQIIQKSTEMQNRVSDTFDDLVAMSHFDNRKILIGTREK